MTKRQAGGRKGSQTRPSKRQLRQNIDKNRCQCHAQNSGKPDPLLQRAIGGKKNPKKKSNRLEVRIFGAAQKTKRSRTQQMGDMKNPISVKNRTWLDGERSKRKILKQQGQKVAEGSRSRIPRFQKDTLVGRQGEQKGERVTRINWVLPS